MTPKKLAKSLWLGGLSLPIVVLVMGAFGKLLHVLGDAAGGVFFYRLAMMAAAFWIVALLGLVLLAGQRMSENDRDRSP